MISFDDAVTAGNLPGQKFSVYYADGRFANRTAVRAREPQGRLYGITVRGLTGPEINICDCESGDMSVAETEAWVAEQVRLGVALIVVYASEDTFVNGELFAALAKYGSRIKRWQAHYDNVAQVPAGYDAKQFADPGPVDHNVALPSFFQPFVKTTPSHYDRFPVGPFPYGSLKLNERELVQLYDRLRAKQSLLRHPNRAELETTRTELEFLAKRCAYLAHQEFPGLPIGEALAKSSNWRGWRFQQLVHRAQGKRLA
jgi:hypothetical protein